MTSSGCRVSAAVGAVVRVIQQEAKYIFLKLGCYGLSPVPLESYQKGEPSEIV